MNLNELISSIPLFSSLSTNEIGSFIAGLELIEFPERTIIIQEGHQDSEFFILVEGWVEIIKSFGQEGERSLGKRSRGTVLGEMSIFAPDGAHSASVIAITPITLIKLTRDKFNQLLERNPKLAYEMVRLYGQRLLETESLTINDLKEKNRQLALAYDELKAAQAQIIEKERMENELEIARRIQQSILPQEMPAMEGFEFGALMIPARAVGGDFFDFIKLPRQHLGIVIGDVSDKGVPAALFMSLSYSLIRAEIGRDGSPGDILRRVNLLLLEMNASGMFVTVFLGILEKDTGKLNYARAGHPQPLLIDRFKHPIRLPIGTGQPLGLFPSPIFDEQQIHLDSGTTMLIFSDGLTEAVDNSNEYFGEERIIKVIQKKKACHAQEVCTRLWQALNLFSVDQSQQDDFTVVTIRAL